MFSSRSDGMIEAWHGNAWDQSETASRPVRDGVIRRVTRLDIAKWGRTKNNQVKPSLRDGILL